MYDYQKIAKALIRNADEIVTAIDRYIAKKDEDLKKTLKGRRIYQSGRDGGCH